MVSRLPSVELKPLLIILVAFFVTMATVILVSQRTGILPRANPVDKGYLGPSSLPPALFLTPPDSLPPAQCTTDSSGCTTCCFVVNGENICQKKSCPAYRPGSQ